LALRRPAGLATGPHRPRRDAGALRAQRLHARTQRRRLPPLPPLRHALRRPAARAHDRHGPGLPDVVAARLADPALELPVFRALQLAQFTGTELLDTDEGLRSALSRLNGRVDAGAVVRALGDDAVEEAYQADRARARTAAGSPTEAQGRAADTDGAVRYTAPSLQFAHADGRTVEAGGFQPLEAYDTCLANLDPTLERRPAATDRSTSCARCPTPRRRARSPPAWLRTSPSPTTPRPRPR